jgi:hypothetical protein
VTKGKNHKNDEVYNSDEGRGKMIIIKLKEIIKEKSQKKL